MEVNMVGYYYAFAEVPRIVRVYAFLAPTQV